MTSRSKRLLLAGGSTLVMLELASCLVATFLLGGCPYRRAATTAFAAALTAEQGGPGATASNLAPASVLHPYLGYVYNPDRSQPFYGQPLNRHGFYSRIEANYRRTNAEEFVVAVFGGSVAAHLCVRAHDVLVSELESLPALAGRRVVINALCQGGYKQPQQVMALNYFLSQGATFDAVVNLDGVNEIGVACLNAGSYGIEPAFPFFWATLARSDNDDRVLLDAMHDGLQARGSRQQTAAKILRWRLVPSATARLFWEMRQRSSRRQEQLAAARMTERTKELAADRSLSFQQKGAMESRIREASVAVETAVGIWAESSRLMHATLSSRGVPYVHALQPNQYFPDTKTFSAREQAEFVRPKNVSADHLRRAYPLLRQRGADLRAQGVAFADLSTVFRDLPGDIYEDDCCHVNEEGNRILARALAAQLAPLLTSKPPAAP